MTQAIAERDEPRMIDGRPEGQLDWQARDIIRDLIRLYGFEEARQMVAMYLNDEAQGNPSCPRN